MWLLPEGTPQNMRTVISQTDNCSMKSFGVQVGTNPLALLQSSFYEACYGGDTESVSSTDRIEM